MILDSFAAACTYNFVDVPVDTQKGGGIPPPGHKTLPNILLKSASRSAENPWKIEVQDKR